MTNDLGTDSTCFGSNLIDSARALWQACWTTMVVDVSVEDAFGRRAVADVADGNDIGIVPGPDTGDNGSEVGSCTAAMSRTVE